MHRECKITSCCSTEALYPVSCQRPTQLCCVIFSLLCAVIILMQSHNTDPESPERALKGTIRVCCVSAMTPSLIRG